MVVVVWTATPQHVQKARALPPRPPGIGGTSKALQGLVGALAVMCSCMQLQGARGL